MYGRASTRDTRTKRALPRFYMTGQGFYFAIVGRWTVIWRIWFPYSSNAEHQEVIDMRFSLINAGIIHKAVESNRKVHKHVSNWTTSISYFLVNFHARTGCGTWCGHQEVQVGWMLVSWLGTESRAKTDHFDKIWFTIWNSTRHGLARTIAKVQFHLLELDHYVLPNLSTLLNFGNRLDVIKCFNFLHLWDLLTCIYFFQLLLIENTTKHPA